VFALLPLYKILHRISHYHTHPPAFHDIEKMNCVTDMFGALFPKIDQWFKMTGEDVCLFSTEMIACRKIHRICRSVQSSHSFCKGYLFYISLRHLYEARKWQRTDSMVKTLVSLFYIKLPSTCLTLHSLQFHCFFHLRKMNKAQSICQRPQFLKPKHCRMHVSGKNGCSFLNSMSVSKWTKMTAIW
jgi:hypothetical protein